MAIIFTKEIEGIYPAYNDSFIEFSSDLANNNKAEISIIPDTNFPNPFVIYPNKNGIYLFNLKEIVKVFFNEFGFKDSNFFTDDFSKSISGLFKVQDLEILVRSDIASESALRTYEFYKAVQQVGQNSIERPFKLLTYSKDGYNHNLTYFEGFPFSFDIQKVIFEIDKVITVKNVNTGNLTAAMPVAETGAFRINVDNSNNDNWTLTNYLSLFEGVNRLEIYENGVFKTNLNLTKKKICKGVYLKWFNSNGGYSHFLFNDIFTETTQGQNIANILNTDFENANEVTGNKYSIGKNGERIIAIKTRYDFNEYEILKDIFISPSIQYYTSQTEFIEGKFIDVEINGTFTHNNKKEVNDLNLIVELPKLVTFKL